MRSKSLETTQHRIGRKGGDIPLQLVSSPLLCYVAWTRIEMFFQLNNARKEDFKLVSDGDGSLKIRPSKGVLDGVYDCGRPHH